MPKATVQIENAEKEAGRVLANGECAGGVQYVFEKEHKSSVLYPSKDWKKGENVFGNGSVMPGWPIASFIGGEYKGAGCHAGIYAGQNADGIQVWDQWSGQAWHLRTLRVNAIKDPNSNCAYNFYVIE